MLTPNIDGSFTVSFTTTYRMISFLRKHLTELLETMVESETISREDCPLIVLRLLKELNTSDAVSDLFDNLLGHSIIRKESNTLEIIDPNNTLKLKKAKSHVTSK